MTYFLDIILFEYFLEVQIGQIIARNKAETWFCAIALFLRPLRFTLWFHSFIQITPALPPKVKCYAFSSDFTLFFCTCGCVLCSRLPNRNKTTISWLILTAWTRSSLQAMAAWRRSRSPPSSWPASSPSCCRRRWAAARWIGRRLSATSSHKTYWSGSTWKQQKSREISYYLN